MRYNFLLIIGFLIWNISAQQVTNTKDYDTWGYIYNGDISNDGKWMFYESNYQSVPDTLIVLSTSGDKKYQIPEGQWGEFSKNNRWFTAFLKDSKLQIIDFKNDTIAHLNDVKKYNYTPDETYLIISCTIKGENSLIIKDLLSGKKTSILNIEEFLIHPVHNKIALILKSESSYSVNILDLKTNVLNELKKIDASYLKNLVWSSNGVSLSFFVETKKGDSINNKIFYCNNNQCAWELDFQRNSQLYGNYQIEGNYLDVSQNGNRVYFKVISKQALITDKESENIQEWNTDDKWIYPMRKYNNLLDEVPLMWYWEPNDDVVSSISEISLPEIIKVNENHVLKYDKLAYEPQYKYRGDVDMYLNNLKTGDSRLLLSKKGSNEVFVSPDGNSIVFFEKEDWWVYNVRENTYINLTAGVNSYFLDINKDRDDLKKPYSSFIAWAEEKEAILIHDEYDVWKFSLNGKTRQRLTKGRELKRTYRIYRDFFNPKKIDQNVVNFKQGFLLQAVDEDMKSGYFYWHSPNFIEKIVFEAAQVDELKRSSDMKYFTYRMQSYDMPPKILFYSVKNRTNTLMVESNRCKRINDWGKAEMIEYSSESGLPTKSVLIYPANYDSNKEYPLIVHVYEKQPQKLHEFSPVSWYSEVGFNPSHYALNGYFILYPFISFEIGNPGISALNDVTQSVNNISQKVKIDKNRIGLIGHSFGGYETSFIITQTDMFAAAVAGAAITDIVNFYHTINWDVGQEEMWRFESNGMRMGGSYYDLEDSYLKNSPFQQVKNISTPLLLWAGKKDLHVNYNESIRLYLALRRLKKSGKLLLFENEHHTVKNLENRRYLTKIIKEWFDSFCK